MKVRVTSVQISKGSIDSNADDVEKKMFDYEQMRK